MPFTEVLLIVGFLWVVADRALWWRRVRQLERRLDVAMAELAARPNESKER